MILVIDLRKEFINKINFGFMFTGNSIHSSAEKIKIVGLAILIMKRH